MVVEKSSQKDGEILLGTKYIVPYKTCIKCKMKKHYSEFHKNSSKKDGRQADCKTCVSEKKKKNYKRKTVENVTFISYISSTLDPEFLNGFSVAFSEGIKGLIESGELK